MKPQNYHLGRLVQEETTSFTFKIDTICRLIRMGLWLHDHQKMIRNDYMDYGTEQGTLAASLPLLDYLNLPAHTMYCFESLPTVSL